MRRAVTRAELATTRRSTRLPGNQLNGGALRSLRQFKGTLVHAVWYFARSKDAFSSKTTTAKAKKAHKRAYRFKYQGHKRARTR